MAARLPGLLRTFSRHVRPDRPTFRSLALSARRLEKASSSATAPTKPPPPPAPSQPDPTVPSLVDTSDASKAALQAPNWADVWAPSQQPRAQAMTGPRFEQTDISQPRPFAAIELIHKQPVRWTHDRVVSCDGGGGPSGHPRIFINVDKPEICVCNYCGLPFAHEHHREHLESMPRTSYPLI